jgi:hypothetical protein
MSYAAPSGWIEIRPDDGSDRQPNSRFHLSRECQAIWTASELRATDRPYGVKRCHLCAGLYS